MNERIKQLAIEARLIALEYNDSTHTTLSPQEQKFAQLLIKECGVALSPMLRDMVSRGQAFDLIKQHFGVEE